MNADIKDFIGVYEGAFTEEYCNKVIKYFEEAVAAGLGRGRKNAKRGSLLLKDDLQVFAHDEANLTFSAALILEFNNVLWNAIYPNYITKFNVLENYDPHTNYSFKVQKTEICQGYHVWHTEQGTKADSGRILVWTLYLNDVDEGGETEFLYYARRIKPKAGTFVIWPAGFTHTHRGNPPISNTKYIVTGWIEH